AEQTAFPCLGFDALLAHPAFRLDGEHSPKTYGPDALSEIEARALFAQPLLDDPDTLADADAFERAMDRANAYWALAQTPAAEREAALREAAERLANGSGDRKALEAEARRTVEGVRTRLPEPARAARRPPRWPGARRPSARRPSASPTAAAPGRPWRRRPAGWSSGSTPSSPSTPGPPDARPAVVSRRVLRVPRRAERTRSAHHETRAPCPSP